MMKFIRDKGAAGRLPEKKNRKGTLRGIPGLALALALGAVLAAGGMGTRAYAWNLDPPGIEEDGELVTFPSTSGKENETEAAGGNKWASGLEEGTTLAILSDGKPMTIAASHERQDLTDLLTALTIKDKDGNVIPNTGGTLYVGEEYDIHLEFKEGGAQGLQFDAKSGELYYQIPDSFKVTPQEKTPLTVTIDGKQVNIGTYSIDESGRLTVELNDDGKTKLEESTDISVVFDMKATAQASEEGGDGSVHFGGAGKEFDFQITDQPRVSVDKEGEYTENKPEREGEMATGGTLEYTVTTKVEHGEVENVVITDVLTPPNTTDAFELEMVETADGKPDVTVKIRHKKDDGTYEEEYTTLGSDDYDLEEVSDPGNPGKKTFQVKLKGKYAKLEEGDELCVTYNYKVDYVPGSTGQFWGNVLNTATATGDMKIKDAANPDGYTKGTFEEKQKSNVEIRITPPGHGIVCKDQDYSEAEKKMHYTLYTVVPATEEDMEWNPLFIYDDMVVEYNGKRWYLPEFKKDGSRRVKNLEVRAVDVENWFDDWNETTSGSEKIEDLEALRKDAELLAGYDFYNLGDDYKPEILKNYVYRYGDKNLVIIFGEEKDKLNDSNSGKWGHWSHNTDRLIITDYDLDMSDMTEDGKITLVNMDDSNDTLTLKPSEVLLAGIKNIVDLYYGRYSAGYSVFFNNADEMNKKGVLDKNTNTIKYTVTMNATDSTVNKYFREVKADWFASKEAAGGWINDKMWELSMQAVFYDELPDGWEYVPGTLAVTTRDKDNYEQYFPYNASRFSYSESQEKGKIIAPLVYFFNEEGTGHNNANHELFNTFNDQLAQLTFTYTLKATDEWLKKNANIKEDIQVLNKVEIEDKKNPHWSAKANVPYFPAQLTKQAEQVQVTEGEGEDAVTYNTNLLKFTLQVNPEGIRYVQDGQTEPQSYLIVTDISQNMEIQMDSIQVTFASGENAGTKLNEGKKDYKQEELSKLESTWPGDEWGMLVPQEAGHFSLIVPNGVPLTVTYEALIPELGEDVHVSNEANIEGIERSKTGYGGSLLVNKIWASGEGSTSKMSIEKVDKNDSSKKLEGAEFRFYIIVKEEGSSLTPNKDVTIDGKTYHCYTDDSWNFTTGDGGKYEIIGWNLEKGNYYILEETKAPDGYELEKPVLFYFGPENEIDKTKYPDAVYVLPGSTTSLEIADPPITYELPETGGPSPFYLYLLGSAFVLMGGAFLLYNRRLARRRTGR